MKFKQFMCAIKIFCIAMSTTNYSYHSINSESSLKDAGYDTTKISGCLSLGQYLSVCEGMGCYSIIRKSTKTAQLEGMYFDSQDSEYKFYSFTSGYSELKNAPFIKHGC